MVAGRPVVVTLTYEVADTGVSPGGTVEFVFPPLWCWQEGQLHDDRREDYITITPSRPEVKFCATLRAWRVGIRPGVLVEITGPENLRPGDTLTLRYGQATAQQAGVRADRWATITPFANRFATFRCLVKPTGEGEETEVSPSPILLDIVPDEPAEIIARVPSIVAAGTQTFARVALLDCHRNAIRAKDCDFHVTDPTHLATPASLPVTSPPRVAAAQVPMRCEKPGRTVIHVIERRSALAGYGNPMIVRQSPREFIYWGDIHGHSNESDGAGSSEDYFRYARDIAGLDFTSLTDHDASLAADPARWERIIRLTEQFNAPGAFVTLHGFEWSSRTHGHRNVYYRDAPGPVLSSRQDQSNTPEKLWRLLDGYKCLVIPHHPPGLRFELPGGMAVMDWSHKNDYLERLVEIFSCHGNSERLWNEDVFGLLPSGGHYVQDALDMGRRLGLIASSDSHNGHPGLTGLYDHTSYDPALDLDRVSHLPQIPHYQRVPADRMRGCLVAVYAEELSREAVFDALASRRCYATTGTRPIVAFRVNDAPMGSSIPPTDRRRIEARAISGQPIRQIELFRGCEVIASVEPESDEAELRHVDAESVPEGTFYYLRVTEQSGDLAWTSPVWIDSHRA